VHRGLRQQVDCGEAELSVQDGRHHKWEEGKRKVGHIVGSLQVMYADDGAFVTTSRWDVQVSASHCLSSSAPQGIQPDYARGEGWKARKNRGCVVPVRRRRPTYTHTHFCAHTRTRTHSLTPAHTSTPTPTHLTNLPRNSHQHPPLLSSEKRRRNTSLVEVSQPCLLARVRDAGDEGGRP